MGASSGGDDGAGGGGRRSGGETMSPENMWLLFACVSMGLFGYAFLKPMCVKGCCVYTKKKKKTEPQAEAVAEAALEPATRTIRIHSARAKFRLFPPGEAYYVGRPMRKEPEPEPKKKKKKKINEKFKACVQNIVINNAIRDLTLAAQNRLTPESNQTEDSTNLHANIKDPQVFSAGLSTTTTTTTANASLKLNGGPINNFARIVQVALLRSNREKEDIQAAKEAADSPEAPSSTHSRKRSSSIGGEQIADEPTRIEVIDETNNKISSVVPDPADNIISSQPNQGNNKDYNKRLSPTPGENHIIHVISPGQ